MSRLIVTSESLIVAPTVLPITVQWAKDHVKALGSSEDTLIESWIKAATAYFEEITGHQVMEATWDYLLDAYPLTGIIELPHPPLREVQSVAYIADDGSSVPFSDGASPETVSWQSYAPQGDHPRRGWVEPKATFAWPIITPSAGRVRIRYTAGYSATAGAAPDLVKAAILLLVGQFEQFRSETHLSERSSKIEQLPLGAQQIMRAFQASALPSVPLVSSWV